MPSITFAAAPSVALALVLGACATGPHPAAAVAGAQSSVRALEADWAAAFNRHDSTAIARYLAPDFMESTSLADFVTRARYLAGVASDTSPSSPITIDDEAVRLYGDVAVATFRGSRLDNGKRRAFRVTDVLRNVDGHWLSEVRHLSQSPSTNSVPNAPPSAPSGGEAALTGVVLGIDSAWNARDADRFAAHFTSDVDFRLVDNLNSQGRDALRADYARVFASLPATARHRGVVDDIIWIRPDVALADIHVFVEQVNPDSSRSPLRTWAGTAVAVNAADGWRIRAVRLQMVPRP